MVANFSDKAPLRKQYLENDDELIFEIIINFLSASKKTVWRNFNTKSYIFKTVGVQALFDFLKRILCIKIIKDEDTFIKYLSGSINFDFSDSVIQASGIGRKDIRNALLLGAGIILETDLRPDDLEKIKKLKS
jgi:hypothetical protein